MKIERHDTIGYENMVAGMAFGRNDPLGVKAGKRRLLEVHARKDMTGTMTEEDAVRKLPPALGVVLYSWRQSIHAVIISAAGRNASRQGQRAGLRRLDIGPAAPRPGRVSR